MSAVIIVEREEADHAYMVHRLVYYVSEVVLPFKCHFPHYQKIIFVVFMSALKLRHYFKGSLITMVSHTPLHNIINNMDATGRVAKW